jgi:P27 family predicted phage terminase small subunit
MAKGRKSQTNALKKLKGTQPIRMNKDEPEASVISKLPNAPRYFNKTSKLVYRNLGQQLAGARVLTITDIEMFISFAFEYGEYIDSISELREVESDEPKAEDFDGPKMYGAAVYGWNEKYKRVERKKKQAWERSMKLASEFGITPAARAKAQAIATGKEEKDPMDDL